MNEAELRERLTPLVKSYARPQAALVPVINLLLDECVGLGTEAAYVLADICGAETETVEGLIEQFLSTGERARPRDLLCFGTICHLMGAKELYEHMRSRESEGLACEVAPSKCLGHCYAAPVLKTRDGALHRVALDETMN